MLIKTFIIVGALCRQVIALPQAQAGAELKAKSAPLDAYPALRHLPLVEEFDGEGKLPNKSDARTINRRQISPSPLDRLVVFTHAHCQTNVPYAIYNLLARQPGPCSRYQPRFSGVVIGAGEGLHQACLPPFFFFSFFVISSTDYAHVTNHDGLAV